MAKDKEDAPAEEVTAEAQEDTGQEEAAAEAPAAAPPQRVAMQVDDSGASCAYANF